MLRLILRNFQVVELIIVYLLMIHSICLNFELLNCINLISIIFAHIMSVLSVVLIPIILNLKGNLEEIPVCTHWKKKQMVIFISQLAVSIPPIVKGVQIIIILLEEKLSHKK